MKYIVVAVTLFVAGVVSRRPGPSRPHKGFSVDDCEDEGHYVVDELNICWYHQCIVTEGNTMKLLPRRCALGSKVSYNFIHGFSNPCTVNFNSEHGYDCTRHQESVDGPPACYYQEDFICFNGGVLVYESDKCWCQCPESWQGDYDCSKPTIPFVHRQDMDPYSNICVNGEPKSNWCKLFDGCLNGGTCYNQCDTFWCDCPDHENNDYVGKRCEL